MFWPAGICGEIKKKKKSIQLTVKLTVTISTDVKTNFKNIRNITQDHSITITMLKQDKHETMPPSYPNTDTFNPLFHLT